MLKILGWIILITLAITGFLALCVWFFPDLEAKEYEVKTIWKREQMGTGIENMPPAITEQEWREILRKEKEELMKNEEVILTASWYSIESLKKEGTWKLTKGVMANGDKFRDEGFTCACRLYPLGTRLRVTNLENGRDVEVRVTDKIGKRFATKRIDLSKAAFQKICDLDKGLCKVKVELLNRREAGGNK